MRRIMMVTLILAGLLVGCGRTDNSDTGLAGGHAQGRFFGIGVFDPGRLWSRMKLVPSAEPSDPAAATLADDEHVIAVIDSRTGEMRQCGDHSGICVATNPWAATTPAELPVLLEKHAAELDADAAAEMTKGSARRGAR